MTSQHSGLAAHMHAAGLQLCLPMLYMLPMQGANLQAPLTLAPFGMYDLNAMGCHAEQVGQGLPSLQLQLLPARPSLLQLLRLSLAGLPHRRFSQLLLQRLLLGMQGL